MNSRIQKASQLFEAKIRYHIDAKSNTLEFDTGMVISKSDGFRLSRASTQAQLFFNESILSILETKSVLINAIMNKSFENIIEELIQYKKHPDFKERYKNIHMIETTPFTRVRDYVTEIMEVLCSFLIKAYDTCTPDLETILLPKLVLYIFNAYSDCFIKYEYELEPETLKQIYFEIEFIIDV